jgi:hypothetical protein
MQKSVSAGDIETAEADFGNCRIEYLGKFKATCETVLDLNQGPGGDCLMKKTEGRKSCDTEPLSVLMRMICK